MSLSALIKGGPAAAKRQQPPKPPPPASITVNPLAPGPRTRLGLDACLAILSAYVRDLPSWYAAGALPWADKHAPELTRQLQAREAALDALAKTEPTETDWRAAAITYMAAWREISDRYRAHRERGL